MKLIGPGFKPGVFLALRIRGKRWTGGLAGPLRPRGTANYVAIQFPEGNLTTPIIRQHTVRLPPAITLAVQLIAGVLFGLLEGAPSWCR
jgi:predicted PurR-regulated permease PerM